MRSEDLARHLKGGLSPLYVLHGDETFLTLEAAQALRDAARQHGYAEREVMTVETGFSWSQLGMVGNSFSLFSEKKLLELRIPTGKPGVEGAKALEPSLTACRPIPLAWCSCPNSIAPLRTPNGFRRSASMAK